MSQKKTREQVLTEAESQRGRLLAFIRRQIGDPGEAEDIYQEVFEELLELQDLGQAIETLSAWLVRVARNKIVDRFRRRKTQSDFQLSEINEAQDLYSGQPDDEWTRTWLRSEIVKALEMLPQEQREVFVMHELEGKSFDEIASHTGTSVNTLLSRKRYAVLFLRNHLKEVYDELE